MDRGSIVSPTALTPGVAAEVEYRVGMLNARASATRYGLGNVIAGIVHLDAERPPRAAPPRNATLGFVAGRHRVWWEEPPYRGHLDFETPEEAEAFREDFERDGRLAIRRRGPQP